MRKWLIIKLILLFIKEDRNYIPVLPGLDEHQYNTFIANLEQPESTIKFTSKVFPFILI